MNDMIPRKVLKKAINRIERRNGMLNALRFTKREKEIAATAYQGAIADIKAELEAYDKGEYKE